MRKLLTLARDDKGISAVEFGFLIPILGVMIGGIVDLSQGLSQRFTLQQSLNRSLEIVQAHRGQTSITGGTPDYSFLKDEVAAAAGVATSAVTLTQWLECSGVKQTSYTATCAADKDTARYLELQVTKSFTGRMFLKTRTTTMTVKSAVRVQ